MNDKYQLNNTGAEVQEVINNGLRNFPSRITSLEANKVDKIAGKGLSSNDYTLIDKDKVNRININGEGEKFLANDGTYKYIGESISYDDLQNIPQLNTSNSESLSSGVEDIKNIVNLHKISKTGSYNDLLNKPTIPTIKLNNSLTTQAEFYAPNSSGNSGQFLKSNGTGVYWDDVTIPEITLNGTSDTSPSFYAPKSSGTSGQVLKSNGAGQNPTWMTLNIPTLGQLNTDNSNSLEVSSSESFSDNINLHKISKTGNYNDLLNTPDIPSITLNGAVNKNPSFYAPTSAGVDGQYLKSNGSSLVWGEITSSDISDLPEVPEITLNGTKNTNPSFYAPTSGGTSGQILKSNGNSSPVWGALDYNDLNNKAISNINGTASSPVVLSNLSNGLYRVTGYYKNTSSDSSAISISSSLFVNKVGNTEQAKIIIEGEGNVKINEATNNGTTWTNNIGFLPKSPFEYIKVVAEYPSTMEDNTLYMKIEEE